ncbi:hypothetical protein UFOVP1040_53 [uncultured Caudovirales phage]|uniref:Uncharacterized protein n=1 Tax=uncultured Caudovirales phage TaxID=2100421 RepID=A0A6J5QL82_9CAUD|nr:hypothetical protein UFOVP1040_53 [uncultured Caudovirales phage]
MIECPGCGNVMYSIRQSYFYRCPVHGNVARTTLVEIQGMERWEANIEIEAASIRQEVWAVFYLARLEANLGFDIMEQQLKREVAACA